MSEAFLCHPCSDASVGTEHDGHSLKTCSRCGALSNAGRWVTSLEVPIPMLLWCPGCGNRHIDRGEFAERPHHTHACQHCGFVWRPAIVTTVGVDFLPGFKDEDGGAAHEDDAVGALSSDDSRAPWHRGYHYPSCNLMRYAGNCNCKDIIGSAER